MSSRLAFHEAKPNPNPIPETKITAAYGLRRSPKLVEQIAGADINVRINALSVAMDELLNPYSVYSCVEAGIVAILAPMVTDNDYITRAKASACLSIIARDSNGLNAIIQENVLSQILLGKQDPSEEVRKNIYECLHQISRTADGCEICSSADATNLLVNSLRSESFTLQVIILKYLYNITGTELGLIDSIESNAIPIIIDLLECNNSDVSANAAKTLGFMCFDERSKTVALESNAITKLLSLLLNNKITLIINNVIFALMSITSTDEGKRQCIQIIENAVLLDQIINYLNSSEKTIKMNTIKLITNIVVYPPIRKVLLNHKNCIILLKSLADSDDQFLNKHAKIAIDAVNWKP